MWPSVARCERSAHFRPVPILRALAYRGVFRRRKVVIGRFTYILYSVYYHLLHI